MAFDLGAAQRATGVDPSWYGNDQEEIRANMQKDLMARARNDVDLRKQLVIQRAKEQAEARRQQFEMMRGMPTAIPSQAWQRQAELIQRLQAMQNRR